ncbi:MAG: D-amino acid dehydrogenase [Myxococcota bacterium]|jgi:D-amino-acid dehydrogenase|nr:D-amino acid dehydrogenase [Myxococcota bacterium]MDP7300795.1 D-amino acid dehydrogenase [Myxococcota bacterium]MDP7434378.1 D-amino acid dehydrogenase [Myxococcota bacterium]HJO22722.1 D-amino acid dehydrogenase [Myxococcota bacterium]
MHVVVVGAGLLGLSTAHALDQDGHEVSLVEAGDGPGLETSFANSGMLSPSLTDPWNAPGIFFKMFRWLGREDAPFLLRLRAVPSLIGWGARFFWQSGRQRYEKNWISNLRLGLYSMEVLNDLVTEHKLPFARGYTGILKVFRNREELSAGLKQADFLARQEIETRVLDASELVELEPALSGAAHALEGAIHHPIDGHGDAYLFCRALERVLGKAGVQFHYGLQARGFSRDGQRIAAVETDRGPIEGEAFVLAAGSHSVELAATMGVRIPVRPAKGYSITLDLKDGCEHPQIPVVDDSLHVALTPLGEKLRVAGTAEFTGYDKGLTKGRIQNLLDVLGRIYPHCAEQAQSEAVAPWCGHRPMSADGVPILGATSVSNLFLNTGHGPLGWTLASGSGRLVSDLIGGKTPNLPLEPYSVARFRSYWPF